MTLSHAWERVPEGRERSAGRVARIQSGKPLPDPLLGFHPNHTGPAMADDCQQILPEVRLVKPGETHHLCRCGHSPEMPDCPPDCVQCLILRPAREQRLLLCRCGRSANLPYCDGSHNPPASGLADKWRRFFHGN
ncbi:CDGSH iron-sulfur domain-containing protein [Ectopseudomonas mendocina]|uniref:CDGSH iron-sulfur domain-containing protein n=1 Tax=Ectopseudomonas mendocina TaxID=300 RepID=UPI0032084A13